MQIYKNLVICYLHSILYLASSTSWYPGLDNRFIYVQIITLINVMFSSFSFHQSISSQFKVKQKPSLSSIRIQSYHIATFPKISLWRVWFLRGVSSYIAIAIDILSSLKLYILQKDIPQFRQLKDHRNTDMLSFSFHYSKGTLE